MSVDEWRRWIGSPSGASENACFAGPSAQNCQYAAPPTYAGGPPDDEYRVSEALRPSGRTTSKGSESGESRMPRPYSYVALDKPSTENCRRR